MLVVYGGGILDARGSIGGNTASRNGSGPYWRARVKPVNPNSDAQSRVRAIMSRVSAMYLDSASSAQRLEWGVFASNMPHKNKLGLDIRLSGFNQFVKSNVAALNAELPSILDGPVIFTLPGEDPTFEVSASESSQELSVIFNDNRDWVDEDFAGMIIQVGIPQNASIGFFNGPWRHADIIRGDSSTAPTTPATIASPWPVVELQKVWVRGKIIRADGRTSDWFQVSPIVGS